MEKKTEYTRIFELFSEMNVQMGDILDRDKLINFFVDKIAQIFKVRRVSFMLLDKQRGELFIKASRGLDISIGTAIIKLGEMFGGWVAKRGEPLLVKDIDTEFPDISKNKLFKYKTKSFVIVPVKLKEGIIGILNMTERENGVMFNEDDFKIISSLCLCLATHLEKLKLSESNVQLAVIDDLTGLFNHRYLQERLSQEVGRAERFGHNLSLLMLDIDNLCWYNQIFGYSAGDSALKQIAGIIKENTRQIDVVSRYGPEEFIIILPEASLKQAVFAGEKIRELISRYEFTEDRSTASLEKGKLTVSVGVVEYKNGFNKEELIRLVVNALLRAKQKGKNCVCVHK